MTKETKGNELLTPFGARPKRTAHESTRPTEYIPESFATDALRTYIDSVFNTETNPIFRNVEDPFMVLYARGNQDIQEHFGTYPEYQKSRRAEHSIYREQGADAVRKDAKVAVGFALGGGLLLGAALTPLILDKIQQRRERKAKALEAALPLVIEDTDNPAE